MTALTNFRPEKETGSPADADQIVALASEGVPVKALARAFGLSATDAWGIVHRAYRAGKAFPLPADDWPEAVAIEDRAGVVRARGRLKAVDSLVLPLRLTFMLTIAEARLLACLLNFRQASRAMIHKAVATDRAAQQGYSGQVLVSRLRRALKPYGIEIRTLHGFGYSLDPQMAEYAMALVKARQQNTAAVAA